MHNTEKKNKGGEQAIMPILIGGYCQKEVATNQSWVNAGKYW